MRRGYVPRLGLRQEIERIAAEKNTRRSRLWGFVALSSIELRRDSLLTGGFLGSACQIRPEECPKELISSAMFSFTVREHGHPSRTRQESAPEDCLGEAKDDTVVQKGVLG